MPVSYTHLDVYKRQGVVCVGEVERLLLTFHGLHGVGAEGAAVLVMAVDRVAAVAFFRAQLQFCLLYTSRCV